MINLFDFCSIHWIFPWLLPALLGLGLGWLLWGKYKSEVARLENDILGLNNTIAGLEADLDACRKTRIEAEGNLSILKGRLREIELSTAGGAVKLTNMSAAAAGATALASSSTSKSAEGQDRWFAAIGTDKLQIIEGIGPKMEEVLNENGIRDFASLSAKSKDELRDILNKYGDKYRIIDPNTWPQQASMANARSWKDLIALQKTLDTGRSDTAQIGLTDSKLEKWLIKARIIRQWAPDDLKAVEGIGPKIEKLLHAQNIKTWRGLSETSVEKIQEILTAAGSRFSLADPGTWPRQAGMAADGLWDDLQTYQDFLNAGKEK
ncbi:MAG: helix-hairpin-helix domain-containing protein [Saprospiraceae bacterium]